jgi:hypothetical protein
MSWMVFVFLFWAARHSLVQQHTQKKATKRLCRRYVAQLLAVGRSWRRVCRLWPALLHSAAAKLHKIKYQKT